MIAVGLSTALTCSSHALVSSVFQVQSELQGALLSIATKNITRYSHPVTPQSLSTAPGERHAFVLGLSHAPRTVCCAAVV